MLLTSYIDTLLNDFETISQILSKDTTPAEVLRSLKAVNLTNPSVKDCIEFETKFYTALNTRAMAALYTELIYDLRSGLRALSDVALNKVMEKFSDTQVEIYRIYLTSEESNVHQAWINAHLDQVKQCSQQWFYNTIVAPL